MPPMSGIKYLLVNAVFVFYIILVSGVQQDDTVIYICVYIYIYMYILFSIECYYKIQNIVPSAIQ